MPFHLYEAGELEYTAERDLMDRLVHDLQRSFGSSAEECHLVIAPRFRGTRPDGLIFRRNRFITLELKDLRGDIIADCRSDQQWTITSQGRTTSYPHGNPFVQAGIHRAALIKTLWFDVLGHAVEEEIPEDLKRRVGDWVVVEAGSSVVVRGLNPADAPGFAALSVDDVGRRLVYQSLPPTPLMSENHLPRLFEFLGAVEVLADSWLMRSLARETTPPEVQALRIPRLDSLFRAQDAAKVAEALQLAARLDLKSYLPEVLLASANPSSAVRRLALEILRVWSPDQWLTRLVDRLDDKDAEVRGLALRCLKAVGVPSAVPALGRILDHGTAEEARDAVAALGATQDNRAGPMLLTYARKALKDGSGTANPPVDSLAWAFGSLRYVPAVPLLLEMLSSPPMREERPQLLDTSSTRERIITALSEIGSREAVPLLLRLAQNSEDEDLQRAAVNALGSIGDLGAKATLLNLLGAANVLSPISVASALALARLGATEVYERVAALYQKALLEETSPGYSTTALEEAVIVLSPERSESLALDLLTSDVSGLRWAGQRILDRIVTPRSTTRLLALLARDETCDVASAFLARTPSPEVEREARRLLRSGSGQVKAAALYLLRGDWEPDPVTRLREYEDDPDWPVRGFIVAAYWGLKTADARRRLMKMIGDPASEVATSAFHALASQAVCRIDQCLLRGDTFPGAVGSIALVPEALVVEGEDRPFVIPVDAITRLASSSVPEDLIYLETNLAGMVRKWVISWVFDPIGPERGKADKTYQAILAVHPGDIGPNKLSASEEESATKLLGFDPSMVP